MSTPTPFSTLSSKPPQPPSIDTNDNNNNFNSSSSPSTTLHHTAHSTSTDSPSTPSRPSALRSPSSNNYASALASAQVRSALTPGTSPLFPLSTGLPMRPSVDPATYPTTNANTNTNTTTKGEAGSSTGAMAEGTTASVGAQGYDGYGDPGFERAEHEGFGEPRGKVVGKGELGEGFRPGIDRMQSWSEQDMKRAMQERLLSPRGDGDVRDMGFSSRQGGGPDD
ncbi:hypothetical protein MMC18_006770 [Xylographa bjoerkii]|nr:hypothetical protein [Xylographa bjoerkii]